MSVGEGHNCHVRGCGSFSRRGWQHRSNIRVEKGMAKSVFCGVYKMKAEEESGPAAGVQEGTNGSAAGEEIVVG